MEKLDEKTMAFLFERFSTVAAYAEDFCRAVKAANKVQNKAREIRAGYCLDLLHNLKIVCRDSAQSIENKLHQERNSATVYFSN